MRLECSFLPVLAVLVISLVRERADGAANLDISQPIVKSSPATSAGDQFGFSVALHQISEPSGTDLDSFLASIRYELKSINSTCSLVAWPLVQCCLSV